MKKKNMCTRWQENSNEQSQSVPQDYKVLVSKEGPQFTYFSPIYYFIVYFMHIFMIAHDTPISFFPSPTPWEMILLGIFLFLSLFDLIFLLLNLPLISAFPSDTVPLKHSSFTCYKSYIHASELLSQSLLFHIYKTVKLNNSKPKSESNLKPKW